MSKRNDSYWGNRKDWLIYDQMESADKTADTISHIYGNAYHQIERNMNNVLDKFALKYRMSKEEALKILNSLDNQDDVEELLRTLRLRSDNESIKELSMMLDAPSYRYRINALKDTMAEVDTVMQKVYESELALSTKHYENTAKESYLKNTFTLQQQIGYGEKVTTLPSSTISKLLKSKWSGENYSKRIWNNTSTLAGDLKTELLTSVLMGRTESETTKLFFDRCVTSARSARRLIRTESAYIYNQMDVEAYKNGGIEYYRFVATLDLKTSTICSELDGKVFKLSEAKVGENYPPMHPWCRSVTIANIDEDTLKTLDRRAGREKVPADMTYKEWESKFVVDVDDDMDLQEEKHNDTIKTKEQEFDIKGNTTKLKGVMSDEDYTEYLALLNNHSNANIKKMYVKYADEIAEIQYKNEGGYYSSSENEIVFSYPKQKHIDNGKSKYSTLEHEYGHFFDAKGEFDGLHYTEIEAIHDRTKYQANRFKKIPSSSDEFLSAVRKDRESLRSSFTKEVENELRKQDASHGVQDAIDGLLGHRINWGHGDKYYNRKYSAIKKLKEHKALQSVYKEMGIDVSNLGKVARECRVYESASEMWANIMSAEINGGEELEYVKKYLPNSYEAIIEILKGVK